jgi:hypothetical protein
MKNRIAHLWNWFWRQRSGVLLLPRVRGGGRLVLELPVLILGVYAWYLYLFSLPANGRNFFLAAFGNPFGAIAILGVLAYQLGISYLRDQLPPSVSFSAGVALLIPGRVLAIYKEQHGTDLAVKLLRAFGLAAFVSFSIGLFLANRGRIHT